METTPPKFDQPLLLVNSKTWNRDSHGLFDYEATNTKNNLSISQGDSMYIRKKNDVREGTPDEVEYMLFNSRTVSDKCFLFKQVDSNMQVTENNINSLQNKIWYVIPSEAKEENQQLPTKTFNNPDYYIRTNDIVKMGRVKYSVNQLFLLDSNSEKFNEPIFDFIYKSL